MLSTSSKTLYSPTEQWTAVLQCTVTCRPTSPESLTCRLRSSTSDQLVVPSYNLTTVDRQAFPVSATSLWNEQCYLSQCRLSVVKCMTNVLIVNSNEWSELVSGDVVKGRQHQRSCVKTLTTTCTSAELWKMKSSRLRRRMTCSAKVAHRFVFSTRQHICLARCMPVRLSVRRLYHRKTVEVRIMKFSPYGSPIPLVFVG